MALYAARKMQMAHTVAELRDAVAQWRAEGLSVALVPTMGALHEGHMSLFRQAKMRADKVIVSIFVNPTQFGPNEDYAAYPRTLPEDCFKAKMAGASLVFAPSIEDMYPNGNKTFVEVGGAMTECLCGASRPGHFRGVATVVSKLLLMAQPDLAVFGEKDYQQLLVIRRLVADLAIPVQIEGAPIHREVDGLALSSRNAYLSDKERGNANLMYKSLYQAGLDIQSGKRAQDALDWVADELIRLGFGPIDYLEMRDAETLSAMDILDRPARLFGAAFMGKTRLIDNLPIEPRTE
jgi:pantoate--beta-alanine ligase